MGILNRIFGWKKTNKNGAAEFNKEMGLSDLIIGPTYAGKTGNGIKSPEQIIKEINSEVYSCEQQSKNYSQRRAEQYTKPAGMAAKSPSTLSKNGTSTSNGHSLYDFAPYEAGAAMLNRSQSLKNNCTSNTTSSSYDGGSSSDSGGGGCD